ncbi:MAG TPA: hypothetical protein VFJ47_15455 [Terriglobales bacterium]|nr:hypothetical protein [Terriglobales bacterium]
MTIQVASITGHLSITRWPVLFAFGYGLPAADAVRADRSAWRSFLTNGRRLVLDSSSSMAASGAVVFDQNADERRCLDGRYRHGQNCPAPVGRCK